MKPRYIGALAPVLWYLIVPYRPGDPSEPLSHWQKSAETFMSEDDCNALLGWELHLFYGKNTRDPAIQEHVRRLQHAQCIGSHDPRLKGAEK